MITIQCYTDWNSYLKMGDNPVDIQITDSDHKPFVDATQLKYLVHEVLNVYEKPLNHIGAWLRQTINTTDKEVWIDKKVLHQLLEWCNDLSKSNFAPCYCDNFDKATNNRVIRYIGYALKDTDDEDYDGQHHKFKIIFK